MSLLISISLKRKVNFVVSSHSQDPKRRLHKKSLTKSVAMNGNQSLCVCVCKLNQKLEKKAKCSIEFQNTLVFLFVLSSLFLSLSFSDSFLSIIANLHEYE